MKSGAMIINNDKIQFPVYESGYYWENDQKKTLIYLKDNMDVAEYGYCPVLGWMDMIFISSEKKIPATNEEVLKILISQAKKRGYTKGVKVNYVLQKEITDTTITFENNRLLMGYVEIFNNGKWNEILELSPAQLKADELLDMINRVLSVNKAHGFNGHLINDQVKSLISTL